MPQTDPLDDYLPLWEFFQIFVRLNEIELPLKKLHQDCCDLLQRAVLGQLRAEQKEFIVVNIPPRVGKTKMMEALCVWMFTYFPDSQIIYTSYAGDLATASSRYIQQVMNSPWYKKIYKTRLGAVQQADFFNTTQGGQMHAEGVGGGLTGKGAGLKRVAGGLIIVDDPAKPDDVLSQIKADAIKFWFENTLKNRRNSSDFTPIVICAQRIGSNDLPGFVLENYPNESIQVKHPALVDGQSIIPETVSTSSLLATQRVNPFAFAAQYQQEPVILGGNLIKTDSFFYFDDLNLKWEKKIITCDTALKAKQSNDYSVLQLWGVLQHKAYLIDLVRGRWETPALLMNAALFFRKHNDTEATLRAPSPVRRFTVEEASAGIGLMQQLRLLGIPVQGIIRSKDKVTRVHEVLPYIATGMVGIYRHLPNLADFLNEAGGFRPDGKHTHDDMVDAMVDGVWECLGRAISIWDVIGLAKKAPLGRQPGIIDACGPKQIEIKPVPNVPGIFEAEVPAGATLDHEQLRQRVLSDAEMRAAGYSEAAIKES